MFYRVPRFTFALIIGLFCSTLGAETKPIEPFIDGYSPVSYFTVNNAEKGSPEFSVQHKGKLYYLTSAEQVEIFNQNPDKYRPRYDSCPYSLTLGKKVPLDPTNFKVIADTLLIFHKAEDDDGLKLWNNKRADLTEQQLIKKADEQYTLLKW